MYSCLICNNNNIASLEILYKHLIDHKIKHTCLRCNIILLTRNQRRHHYRKHAKIIKCGLCDTFYEKLNEREHIKSHEYLYSVDQLNFIVDVINQKQGRVTNKIGKISNMVKYQGNKPNCPIKDCDENFQTEYELFDHFIYHRLNHLCEFCKEILPNDEKYLAHIKNKICCCYSCYKCKKSFSIMDFIQHISTECITYNFDNSDINEPTENETKLPRIYDNTKSTLICSICDENITNIQLLSEHLWRNHETKFNVCPMCLCLFDDEPQLQNHISIGCNEELLISEDIHSKLTQEINEFYENQNQVNANKKVYVMCGDRVLFQCNVCCSKFVKFYFLKKHCNEYNHELIICSVCLDMFNTRDQLCAHNCQKYDNCTANELKYRQQFRKNLKRKHDANTVIFTEEKGTSEREHFQKLYNNGDINRRMSALVNQLDNMKFPNLKVTKNVEDTPTSSSSTIVKSSNDVDYDLNNILTRIFELRNKRLNKPDLDETNEELETNTKKYDTDISKNSNNEYDLNQLLPRIIHLRHKRRIHEIFEEIDICEEDLDTSEEEPPNKRNKNDTDDDYNDESDDDTLDFIEKIKAFIETFQNSEPDEKSNKIAKY